MTRAYAYLSIPVFFIMSFFASAQNQNGGITLRCRTADGDVVIGRDYVALRNYTFRFERTAEAGVYHLVDQSANATAQLDLRSNVGVYLCVREEGQSMQIVASRASITSTPDTEGRQPSSSISSEDVFHERVNLVNLVRLGEYADASR